MNFLDLIDNAGPDWHRRAVCHPDNGYDPDIWFPLVNGGMHHANRREPLVKRAQEICMSCSVRAQCLEDAIANDEKWGVRGGVDLEAKDRGAADVA